MLDHFDSSAWTRENSAERLRVAAKQAAGAFAQRETSPNPWAEEHCAVRLLMAAADGIGVRSPIGPLLSAMALLENTSPDDHLSMAERWILIRDAADALSEKADTESFNETERAGR